MQTKNSNWRIIVSFCMVITLFFTCILRIFVINNSGYTKVQQQNNSYRLELSKLRGTIFDCNMRPLTNNTTKTVAAFMPNESAVSAAATILNDKDTKRVLASLRSGIPQTAEVEAQIDCYGVYCTKVYVNTSSRLLSPQLIGYLDADGHGVSGIQKAYDDLLYSDKTHFISVAIDGLGNTLAGGELIETTDESVINSGIKLTIDSDIQEITRDAMKNVKCGAAVITEIGTGKIRAMVSMPEFDAANIADYLGNEGSPFVNRAISAYNVGSVFKPCVAAAGIEAGQAAFTYNCTGMAEISGHTFKCHNLAGHKTIGLKDALAYSCNVFFYNIAVRLGADSVYSMSSALGFGSGYEICNGISCSATLTSTQTLRQNDRALVNLSIGQGELLLSPVSILSLYEAIANGGIYYPQTVIEGVVTNGAVKAESTALPTRVMSSETAETIKNHLAAVLEYGTGTKANPTLTTAAGKTATAETGWEKNGRLVENSWFCGFFPLENPKYAVAILIEDSLGGDDIAAPVFSSIADGITTLENSKK